MNKKSILYFSNIEVPYRVRFFNELSNYCDLTVLYESKGSQERNKAWAKSVTSEFATKYLNEEKGSLFRNIFSIWKEITLGYDVIIIGCYNDPIQMLAIQMMNLCKCPYLINLDGESFLDGNGIKTKLKRWFLKGAEKYVVAGEKPAESIKKIFPEKEVISYGFSSLSDVEINQNRPKVNAGRKSGKILVVGQYFDYKGMDIALKAAEIDTSLQYKFVGLGPRTEQFRKDFSIPENVEIIPFLQKQELEKEYQECSMLVLPSRNECWGLVINEAASFGTPIVATWGSGAAVEFLADTYPEYLANPGDEQDLYRVICNLLRAEDCQEYSNYLLNKSLNFSIEKSVQAHLRVLKN